MYDLCMGGSRLGGLDTCVDASAANACIAVTHVACITLQVYGISADKPKSQANWRKKESLTYNLLCDPSKKVRQEAGGCMLHGAP